MEYRCGVCGSVLLVGWLVFSAAAQDVPDRNPQTAVGGRSPAARIYAKYADSVVFVTGVNVKPEKKEWTEFIQPRSGTAEDWTVGTGFIVHPDGWVLTNAHSVMRSVSPVVELRNGSRYDAQVLCVRAEQDLALLKIDAEETLRAVKFETSKEVFVGDTVLTIGCPHSLKHTLTWGILSGINRSSQVVDIPGLTLKGLLQTDASINPGSSGGPWFNLRGRVIAMTVSKRGDSDNIAFGISIATLHEVLPEMFASVLKTRFRLGFEVVRDDSAPYPTRVISVESDAMREAGLRVGDRICSVNGTAVGSPLDFYRALLPLKSGEEVSLQWVHPEDSAQADGESAPSKEMEEIALEPVNFPEPDEVIWDRLRLYAVDLTPGQRKKYLLRTEEGVWVTELDAKLFGHSKVSPKEGDVLVRVNYIRPRNVAHLAQILERIPPETPLELVFIRSTVTDGKREWVRIDIPNFLRKSGIKVEKK
ncbi:MAG: trypsin-like peptidase domain-containing protein [Planctomycetia bacterium]|nr:trypsin-like peptidase domain-containing protein [Planctomycetia bacterium]